MFYSSFKNLEKVVIKYKMAKIISIRDVTPPIRVRLNWLFFVLSS
jgi:hypothetical protein